MNEIKTHVLFIDSLSFSATMKFPPTMFMMIPSIRVYKMPFLTSVKLAKRNCFYHHILEILAGTKQEIILISRKCCKSFRIRKLFQFECFVWFLLVFIFVCFKLFMEMMSHESSHSTCHTLAMYNTTLNIEGQHIK